MNIAEFIERLYREESKNIEQLQSLDNADLAEERLKSLREAGLIEEQDISEKDEPLDRRTAARLIHLYIRDVLGINDLRDITPSYQLRDLFDCRVCANHIAQVYQRGIISAVRINEMLIFDVFRTVTDMEVQSIEEKLSQLSSESAD